MCLCQHRVVYMQGLIEGMSAMQIGKTYIFKFVQDVLMVRGIVNGIINVQIFPADYAHRCHRPYGLGAAASCLPFKVLLGAQRRVQCFCATSTHLLQSVSNGAFERFKRRAGLFAATKQRCAN